MSLMGLDIGTTGTKAIVFGLDGRILSSAYREYNLHSPHPGWMELNPKDVWTKVAAAIKEAVGKAKGDPVKAISISCLGEAVTPIDRNGRFIGPTIIGFETRNAAQSKAWMAKVAPMEVFKITGHSPSHIYSILKLMWAKHEQPTVFKAARKYLCWEDLAIHMMGLPPTIDYSLAARTMAFDIKRCAWSEKIGRLTGIDLDLLAAVAPSGTVVGEIGIRASKETGLPKGCKVVTGGHDQPAGAAGAGIIKGGIAMDATGTVECVTPSFAKPVLNRTMLKNNFCCYHHVAPGLYVTLAFNFTGGSLLKWVRDTFAEEEKREAKKKGVDVYDILIARMHDGPTDLFVVPHFTSTGTPYMDPDPTGAIIGLNLKTTKEQIVKAVLEGITYEIKLNLMLLRKAGIEVNEIRAIGGGAKSAKWLQLKADMFNTKVVRLSVTEAACLGVALSAGVAIGEFRSFPDAVKGIVKPEKVFLPRPQVAKAYDEKVKAYERLYPALKAVRE
ncbi:MAG: FGGY-family carbohydrate kinase [Planctomycetota bacterium]